MAQNSISRAIEKRRGEITALPMYYSGPLLKKYTGEKDFKKFCAELRGSTIFLYTDDKNYKLNTPFLKYSEKVELENLKEMQMESPREMSSTFIYTLTLQNEEVLFKIDGPNTAEEWRAFIMTAANLEIPSKVQLLPGQQLDLEQVLEQERTRTSQLAPPIPCTAQREEAEQMLEENPQCGSIMLRPSTGSSGYAVSIRQIMSSGPVMKHYRVQSGDTGFVIALDEPVAVPSLQDVLDHFLRKMKYRAHPYTQSQPYDTCIVVPEDLAKPKPKPAILVRPIPRARLAPVIHTQTVPSASLSKENPQPMTR